MDLQAKFGLGLRHTDWSVRKDALVELEECALPRAKDGTCKDQHSHLIAMELAEDPSPAVRRMAVQVPCTCITLFHLLFLIA
jgi:hypothetical protein